MPWRLARSEVIRLVCPACGARGRFSYHGYYLRNTTCSLGGCATDSKVPIERLRCMSCRTTHAVISYALIPWQPYALRFALSALDDEAQNAFSSVERLCEACLMGVNTYCRMKRRFAHHIRLLLGAAASADEAHAWLRRTSLLPARALERVSAGFLKAYGVSLSEGRRARWSNCANAP